MITIDSLKRIRQEPTPANIRAQLGRLGLTQQQGAELLRINPRTMRRYLQEPGTPGSVPMPFPTFVLLRMVEGGEQ